MKEEKKAVALTYKEPRAWAILEDDGALKDFSLEACKAASQCEGEAQVYALLVLGILAKVDEFVKEVQDDDGVDSNEQYDIYEAFKEE